MNVATTPEVASLLADDAPVAIGVSGGKDSCALAFATIDYLDSIGHRGPRVLVHSDLGRVEWKDSLPTCERLAAALGVELIVVKRAAGGMMERWLTRWENNVQRYADLSCVKLILPWSTPAMRFCTSELKTAIICRELIRRFPGQTIISASGIRREESPKRRLAQVAKTQPKLASTTHDTDGVDWHPIIEWPTSAIFPYLEAKGFAPHEAYTRYGMSRVSCAFCIMSNEADLRSSAACPDNVEIYTEMVDLEIESTFAFQGDSWLADVAPGALSPVRVTNAHHAKVRAQRREAAERRIPDHLLYEEGWPKVMPTEAEAEMLAEVRREVADAVGLTIKYTDAASILARYRELMAMRDAKNAKKSKRTKTS